MTTPTDWAQRDPALRPMLDALLPGDQRARLEPTLHEMGVAAAGEVDDLAAVADAHTPTLRTYSPDGERIDEVEHHPAHDRLREIAFSRFGLAAMSHRPGVLGWPTPVPHVAKYALSYLFVQAEFGIACPLSMTDSAARVLRRFDPERHADAIARLTATDVDELATGAMFMTEINGGSDVGRTETVAVDHGTHWTLTGRKWFASNVSGEVVLTLARVPGQGTGTRGLGMFLVPRLRPDGTRNGIRIDRLKDKMGARSMATGEVTLVDAHAEPVGDLARGFPQMAEMVNVSRLSNAMRAAALMRRAVRESVDHTRARVAFGRPLLEAPLMRATLLPLVLEAEAALALVLESAARLDEADAGNAHAAALVRVLTPLAKYRICKQARTVTAEAMEIRGGNGYINDFVNPRLLRDAHLGSIWEGSSNVIALDVLRCLRRDAAHHTLAAAYLERLDTVVAGAATPELATAAHRLAEHWRRIRADGDRILTVPTDEAEVAVAVHATTTARTIQATVLLEHAAHQLGAGLGYRALLVAAITLERLDDPDALPATALDHLEVLAEGGDPGPGAAATLLGPSTSGEFADV